MTTLKSAKRRMSAFKAAVARKMGYAPTNRKIAGAVAIGAIVGASAAVMGIGMLQGEIGREDAKLSKEPTA